MTKMTDKKKRLSRSDRVFDLVCYFILFMLFIITAYPLYFVIIASISDPAKVSSGRVLLYPVGINLEGYRAVLGESKVLRGFFNSIVYTAVGTFVNIVVTVPCAYSLSRPDLKYKKHFMLYFMLPMFISGGLIPTYLVVREFNLINSMWALILPGAISVFNLIVARTFFQSTISGELLDAATIDGCGNTRFFWHIALPLSKAIIAILVLYYGVGHWNSYFSSMIYLVDQKKFPLQLVLRSYLLLQNQNAGMVRDQTELAYRQQLAELMKYSLIILSSIPVMVLYPLVQRHFVKGVMIGSLKG